jgi:hypothetical protein
VWLALAPTKDVLFVCLDFEGLQSVEVRDARNVGPCLKMPQRSHQEDALLVLLNTAISNLILFRNNFALGRDLTDAFGSFQNSASILDPTYNPQLFQSTLCIIIKDVISSDAPEIVREFSSKFRRIVTAEQESNFITRLHRGKLNIVAWPVIQDARFYTSYGSLKKQLLQSPVTHKRASVFLQTLKVLQAKIKVCDWTALDANLTQQRVANLRATLPSALALGTASLDDDEPLKNLDTDEHIAGEFHLAQLPRLKDDSAGTGTLADREVELQSLVSIVNLDRFDQPEDFWYAEVQKKLTSLAAERISLVDGWLKVNLARFQNDNSEVQGLLRTFENASIEMHAAIQLCGEPCPSCFRLCIKGKRHDARHDCKTDHKCRNSCDFLDDHEQIQGSTQCGLAANHASSHMCDPSAHSCGAPCSLSDKPNCGKSCMLSVEHEGPHLCASRVHACGEVGLFTAYLPKLSANQSCDLQNCLTKTGRKFTCPKVCARPHDEDHKVHACAETSCPLKCFLCARLWLIQEPALALTFTEWPTVFICAARFTHVLSNADTKVR